MAQLSCECAAALSAPTRALVSFSVHWAAVKEEQCSSSAHRTADTLYRDKRLSAHELIREPKHVVTRLAQPSLPLSIRADSPLMVAAINLDDEADRASVEVDDVVAAQRHLPTEGNAQLLGFEVLPKQPLGVSGTVAHATCILPERELTGRARIGRQESSFRPGGAGCSPPGASSVTRQEHSSADDKLTERARRRGCAIQQARPRWVERQRAATYASTHQYAVCTRLPVRQRHGHEAGNGATLRKWSQAGQTQTELGAQAEQAPEQEATLLRQQSTTAGDTSRSAPAHAVGASTFQLPYSTNR
jgi:hypothetical protein